MGTPSTPNISHTANSKVKAVVERASTRLAAVAWACKWEARSGDAMFER
jgi:hypothetical protein